MQITAKLAALYIQVLQQPQTLGPVHPLAFEALHTWLAKAGPPTRASPDSHAAVAVRQQLQESQLLQHLGTAMDAAAVRLTAAAAAAALAAASSNSGGSSSDSGSSSSSSSNSSSGGSSANTRGSSSTEQVSTQQLTLDIVGENFHSGCLLKLFMLATFPLSAKAPFSIQAALPAAPAALRLMLTVYQNYHMRPQMQLCSQSSDPLLEVHGVMLSLACGIGCDVDARLQSCPEASQLLLSPELLSGLAVELVVIVLGLNTSSDRLDPRLPSRQEQQQQQQADSSGSSSVPSSGVRLDSLTPLSCSLFDVLGVTKETALLAARVAHSQGHTDLPKFNTLVLVYNSVLNHQVRLLCWLSVPWCLRCV